ncbi:Troponin I, slow skeletal muscle, partial [Cichlidogyrus casuarinus]
ENEKKAVEALKTKERIKEERRRKTLMKEQIDQQKEVIAKQRIAKIDRMKKGLGGMNSEKRKRLKEIIMQRAHEEMQNERMKVAEERKLYLANRVPPLDVDNLSEAALVTKVQEMYNRLATLHSESYDLEQRVIAQENEIYDITQKMTDLDCKGK